MELDVANILITTEVTLGWFKMQNEGGSNVKKTRMESEYPDWE